MKYRRLLFLLRRINIAHLPCSLSAEQAKTRPLRPDFREIPTKSLQYLVGISIAVALVLVVAAGCAPRATAPAATASKTPGIGAAETAAAAAPAQDAGASSAQSARPAQQALSTNEAKIKYFSGQLINTPAKDITLKDLSGKEWKLSDLKGKVVLLNFWGTWCGPCQREMPGFQNLQNLNRDDVQILAVASAAIEGQDEKTSLDTVTKFIQQQKYTFPVLFDADGSAWFIYQQQGIPANYILDKQGNVRLLQPGAFANDDEMMAALEAVRRLDGE